MGKGGSKGVFTSLLGWFIGRFWRKKIIFFLLFTVREPDPMLLKGRSQNRSSRICSNAPKSKFLSCGHLGVECPEDVEGRSAALQGRLDDDVIAVTREQRPATLQDRRPTAS
jgi:hypothetical protein